MRTLVTGAFPLDDTRRKALENLGLELTFHADEREPVQNPERYEAVICNGLFSFQNIDAFTALRYIQLTSAGLDRVPVDQIRDRGIVLHNAAGVYSVPMAEFALFGLLSIYKQGKFFYKNQTAHRWEKHRGLQELAGKKVCILGTGSVGREVAKRLKAFDCTVLGVNRTVRQLLEFDQVLPLEALEQTLALSDILVLTIALTEQTKALVRSAVPGKMKPGAVLVNLARGALVEESGLISALESGHLSGAVLDVFEQEPLHTTSPLWDMENVILTPHNSFVGEGNQKRLLDVIQNNFTQFYNY